MRWTRRAGATALAMACAAAAAPAADASAAPVARGIRIIDHPAMVRIVIRFAGGPLAPADPEAADPGPQDGSALVTVTHPGIGSTAPALRRLGVRVRIVREAGRLRIRLHAAAGRFKYLAYHRRHGPERLVVDLYKAAPPSRAAERPGTPSSCISISSHADTGGSIRASGRAHGVFEDQLSLVVRNRRGRLLDRATVAFGPTAPRWKGTVDYTVTADQRGTLEAIVLSARDGSLSCIAQLGVPLAAPLLGPPPP